VRSRRASFGTEVYISSMYAEVFNCGLALVQLYMHIICMYGAYLILGSFGTEVYVLGYIWKYLAYNSEFILLFLYIYYVGLG
jgi:hypothetical protein